MIKIFLSALFFTVCNISVAQQLSVSDTDSKVGFTIKNIGLNVEGSLKDLKGKMQFDPKSLSSSGFDVTVEAATINTGNAKRDEHLKKSDFFDAAKYPTVRIATSQIVSKGRNKYKAIANLTIKNITKKIGFDFTATAITSGYVFTSSFTLNRRDFGVGGSSMTLGDIVTVNLEVVGKK